MSPIRFLQNVPATSRPKAPAWLELVAGCLFGALLLTSPAIEAGEGFYADVFINGGCWLTARNNLAAADYLELSQEALALPYQPSGNDQQIQNAKLVGDANDSNGALLYPDGAPRFRLLQTNGGAATAHGGTLGSDGRQRVRDFYHGGGSYTGTCAGFFIASLAAYDDGNNQNYFHIWPGRLRNTGLTESRTGMFIESDSPLLDYYDFGGDLYVDAIYHNGGGYAPEDHPEWPPGTEILARYDYPARAMHEQVSTLAYKADEHSGRLVIIGSHPEGVTSGERRDLMAAMLLYALDGQGSPQVKAELESGVWRSMDLYWEDGDPSFTRIGDRQYHHFLVRVPAGASRLEIELEGESPYDLDLFLRYEDFAFASNADFASTLPAAQERIALDHPAAGDWYVSVHCQTTVDTIQRSGYVEYSGPVGVLNGVAYSLMAQVEVTRTLSLQLPEQIGEGEVGVSGAVRVLPSPDSQLEIHLESNHPHRLVVPATVTLLAGEELVPFALLVPDDLDYQPPLEVDVLACAPGLGCTLGTILVIDDDPLPMDPTCTELGGVCCPASETCQGETEEADCDTVCCLGLCVGQQSDWADEPDASLDLEEDPLLDEPFYLADGSEEVGEQTAIYRSGSTGCACTMNLEGAGSGRSSQWWNLLWPFVFVAWVGRRRARV